MRNRVVEEAKKQIAELPKVINVGQQNKHIAGMKEYNDYKSRLAGKNQHGSGWIYGGIDGARSLAHKYWKRGKMKSLFEYLHTRVRIKTKDGRTLEGDVDGVASGLETESGYDEISLEYPEWQEIVDESEIASIEALAAYRPPVGQLRAAK